MGIEVTQKFAESQWRAWEECAKELRLALAKAQRDICNSSCTLDPKLGPHCIACLDAQEALKSSPGWGKSCWKTDTEHDEECPCYCDETRDDIMSGRSICVNCGKVRYL